MQEIHNKASTLVLLEMFANVATQPPSYDETSI